MSALLCSLSTLWAELCFSHLDLFWNRFKYDLMIKEMELSLCCDCQTGVRVVFCQNKRTRSLLHSLLSLGKNASNERWILNDVCHANVNLRRTLLKILEKCSVLLSELMLVMPATVNIYCTLPHMLWFYKHVSLSMYFTWSLIFSSNRIQFFAWAAILDVELTDTHGVLS